MSSVEEGPVRVATLGELPPGTAMLVEVGGRPICLARTEDGEVFAVDDTCTHEDESLSGGWLDGTCIECPAHNSIFDLRTGEPITPPAEEPVATHTVTLEGQDILISVHDQI